MQALFDAEPESVSELEPVAAETSETREAAGTTETASVAACAAQCLSHLAFSGVGAVAGARLCLQDEHVRRLIQLTSGSRRDGMLNHQSELRKRQISRKRPSADCSVEVVQQFEFRRGR